jgi:hypothetical protein
MAREAKRGGGFRVSAAGLLLAGLLCAGAAPTGTAPTSTRADFSLGVDTFWVPDRPAGDDFLPPPEGPGPVRSDKAYAYNPLDRAQGQLTYRVADVTNPILQPWAAAQMQAANEQVLAGKIPFTARDRCWPAGVPGFDIYERDRPIYFLQTEREVLIVTEYDQQVRHVYMNVPHSAAPKPSWYGESVGHYEGDTLVVDTIGLNDKSFVDNYRTPHTSALHVVERFRLLEGGKILQVVVEVEDPGAFTTPWTAVQRWRQRPGRPIAEVVCAENSGPYFGYAVVPIPTAERPDF